MVVKYYIFTIKMELPQSKLSMAVNKYMYFIRLIQQFGVVKTLGQYLITKEGIP